MSILYAMMKNIKIFNTSGLVIIMNGDKQYRRANLLHREDGPAIEKKDGTKEWWIDGNRLTEEEFKRLQFDLKPRSKEKKEKI